MIVTLLGLLLFIAVYAGIVTTLFFQLVQSHSVRWTFVAALLLSIAVSGGAALICGYWYYSILQQYDVVLLWYFVTLLLLVAIHSIINITWMPNARQCVLSLITTSWSFLLSGTVLAFSMLLYEALQLILQ